MKSSIYKKFINIILFTSGFIVTFNSFIQLYSNKKIILRKIANEYTKLIGNNEFADERQKKYYKGSDKDTYWAKELLNGGYILHFRHAERDKWIDVQMYDALESDIHNNGSNGTRFAEKDYFKDAVCLNSRGEIQAKLMGEQLKNINFPIGYVVSSPSCRSRQTANIAFEGYDELDRDLVHIGPYVESSTDRKQNLIDLYLNLPLDKTKNTIVSAHNGVIIKGMFSNNPKSDLDLEEGGFYVISKNENKLYLEHRFYSFNSFIRQFHPR